MPGETEASAWTEHQHSDGRRYYYNRVTKQSSWDKPDALKSQEEKANTTSWKEYKTADGRDYFYNPITKQSVWEMPAELKRLRGLDKQDESDEEEKEEEKEEEPEYKTQEERRTAFKEVLEEKNIKANMKWEEALKLIQEDRRFNALTTAGERKQVFAEYVTQKKKREKEEEREKKKQAKDHMIEAIKGWKDLKLSTRYKEVAEAFMDEEWFKLIEEDERDELFQDFMDEHERKAKDDRRKKRKEYVEKVKKIYDDTENITVLSRWRDVQDTLRENETFRWLSKLEALTSWEEWVADTEKKELDAKAKAKYRQDRIVRDELRELLAKRHKDGKIKASTPWRDVAQAIRDDSRYINMIGLGGSTAHDLFDDFIEELNERYKEDRNKIKKFAKAKGIVVTSSSTYASFHDALKDEEGYLQIPEEHRTMLFDSLVAKAKEQDEDAEKNAKKNRKKFVELLQKTRDVTASTTYEAAAKLLGSNAAWDAVDEQTRRQCFDIFVDQLKIQSEARKAEAGGDDGASDAGSDDDARHKKEKRKERGSKKKQVEEEPPPKKAAKKTKRDRDEDEEDEPVEKKKQKKHKR
eukprot:TRINITY_DN72008_c0_g1_i1.p1 TRINITY_DN72008_c0_g1~~TRINITY_DN72008_c0_g1_i1.p1  ORF type:complete len:580 (-),score=182.43 TRINITY_DN72008_c0_g1_i1:174-1913(-)